jgi:sugar-phosphatase
MEAMSLPADSATVTLTARAVLFDMDGTLVDSTAIVERVWAEFAGRYSLDIAEILRTSHGVQALDTVRRFAPEGADIHALAAELGQMELTETEGIIAVPGALQLLEALPADAVALVTSASRDLATVRMAAAGVEMPAAVVAAEDVSRGKPHPECYLRGASLLGAEPSEAVVFEDAPAGIAAGVAAGIRTVAVGPNVGVLPDGVLHIPDYSSVTASVEADDDGRRVISLYF